MEAGNKGGGQNKMPPERLYRVGVDLGGTNIAVGVVDRQCNIVGRHSMPTKRERPFQAIIGDMAVCVHEALGKAGLGIDACASVGVGCPGICNEEAGVVTFANNIRWSNVPLRAALAKLVGRPVFISNDANCAALGEVLAGAAKGVKNAVMLTLGTGVGGGVILDGKIYSGKYSGGGELGHTMLVLDGGPCTCGRKGCLEVYASATGLIAQTKAMMAARPDSLMHELCGHDLENVTGRTAFDADRRGDEAARRVVDTYIYYLSEGIIDFVNVFRPEVIIIGGGVSEQGERLLKPLNDHVAQYCYGGVTSFITPVIKAALGNDAGIVGAAMLHGNAADAG